MKRKLIAVASAAMIGLTAAVATPSKVEAHSCGWWIPGAIVGGLALGAIASGAYRPYYGYGYDPYYYGGGPYYYGRPYYRHYHHYRYYGHYRRYY